MNNTTYKTFKLHPDQKEIVEAALNYVKEKTGTKFDTVAPELICQQFMGTGIAFKDAEQALTAEFKNAGDPDTFIERMITLIEKISRKTITAQVE